MKIILINLLFVTSLFAYPQQKEKNTTLVNPPWRHTWGVRKAGPLHLKMFVGNKTVFRNPQGLAVSRLFSWDKPDNNNDEAQVTVYGVNSGEGNIIFNSSMKSLGIFNRGGSGDSYILNNPAGICSRRNGDVYLADTGNNRILKLFNPGNKLKSISELILPDSLDKMKSPRQAAVTGSGLLGITDTGNDRILFFQNDSFKYMIKNSPDGIKDFIRPDAIVIVSAKEKWNYWNSEFLVIIDSLNSRISKYDLNGKQEERINAGLIGCEKPFWGYAAADYYSNIYVTDRFNNCLYKFDRFLNLIDRIGGNKGDIRFDEPRGIAVRKRFGQIFIAEKTGAQYFWAGTDVREIKAEINSETGGLNVSFYLTEYSLLSYKIEDDSGNAVKGPFTLVRWCPVGKNKNILNSKELESILKHRKTSFLKVIISARATYSSKKHFSITKEVVLPVK